MHNSIKTQIESFIGFLRERNNDVIPLVNLNLLIEEWYDEHYELTRLLPSGHQLGDKVKVQFGNEGTLNDCRILQVHFTESKVFYDVEVRGDYDPQYDMDKKWHTRLYKIDAVFVTK